MKAIMKQYKNLILLTATVILVVILIAADPLGFCAKRAQERAAIYNQMAIEKAETEQQIAIINAQTEAALAKIQNGEPLEDTGETADDINANEEE